MYDEPSHRGDIKAADEAALPLIWLVAICLIVALAVAAGGCLGVSADSLSSQLPTPPPGYIQNQSAFDAAYRSNQYECVSFKDPDGCFYGRMVVDMASQPWVQKFYREKVDQHYADGLPLQIDPRLISAASGENP